jgi:Cupin superfamily protein
MMELHELLAPFSEEEFFNRFWEKEVLNISRNNPKFFSFLNGELSLEKMIQLFCRQWGDVSLARAGTKPAECPYINGSPDLRAIRQAFREKYTVVVNDLQLKDLAIASFCRTMERSFFCRANVNAYFTNCESQGLKAHYDDDDVFILQLRGGKAWRIYKERAELPLAHMPYAELVRQDSPYDTFSLSPGDVLYIPRGVVHEATTDATVSLHLTLSLNTMRWTHLLEEIIRVVAEDEIKLRRSISPKILKAGVWPSDDFRSLEALRDVLLDGSAVRRAVCRLQDKILSGMSRLAVEPLAQTVEAALLDQDSHLRTAPDQVCCIEQTEQGCKLKAVDAEFEFPPDMMDLVRFVCTIGQFSPHQLPGPLSMTAKLEIAQQFVNHGLLMDTSAARVT